MATRFLKRRLVSVAGDQAEGELKGHIFSIGQGVTEQGGLPNLACAGHKNDRVFTSIV